MTTAYQLNNAVSLRQPQTSGTGLHVSMELDPYGGSVQLQKHQSAQLHDAAGWTVKALAGTVWITQDSDVRDIVLEPGESFVVDRDGGTLLYSLEDARICIARKPGLRSLQARQSAGLAVRLPFLRTLLA